MANPQIENGYIKIANEILDQLIRLKLSNYEFRVLLYIIRRTYGFNKKKEQITLAQFSRATGIRRQHIHRSLKKLESRKIIVISTNSKNRATYRFQKNYEKWETLPKQATSLLKTNSPNIKKQHVTSCPHEKIIQLYHDILPELPRIRVWDDPQRSHLRTRWREDKSRQNLDWWNEFFYYIRESDFLMGNKKDWRANLGWIVRRSNFNKILNGNYHNQKQNKYIGMEQWYKWKIKQIENEDSNNTH